MAGSRTRGVLAAVLATALAGACSGAGRSEEAFCAELDASVERMRANVEGVEAEDALGNLGAGLANFGEYTAMLRRLAEVAPEEIRVDMEAASDAWAQQSEAIGNAASDPIGALGAGFMATLSGSASFARVDEFAQANCGTLVFGL